MIEAIYDCNRLTDLTPNNVNALYIRGCCYQKLEMIDLSIQEFTKVLDLDPGHINAAYARGASENKRGNFLKAI